MAVLLSGKPVAEHMCRDIRLRCEKLSRRGVTPTLGIVRVGRREEDIAYERGAIRRAESLNIAVRRFLLPADASQQELIQTLRTVNEDSSIHGCLLFRPLPPHLDTEAVTSVLAPEKDIDAITTASMGGLLTKSDIGFPPCTATACLELLHYYDIPLKGKKIAMIGKSATVGLPTALLLMGGHRLRLSHLHRQGGHPQLLPGRRHHHLRRRLPGPDPGRLCAPGPGGGRCGRQYRPGRRHAWGRGL